MPKDQHSWVCYPSVRQSVAYAIATGYFYDILSFTPYIGYDLDKGGKATIVNERDRSSIWKTKNLKGEVQWKVGLKMQQTKDVQNPKEESDKYPLVETQRRRIGSLKRGEKNHNLQKKKINLLPIHFSTLLLKK